MRPRDWLLIFLALPTEEGDTPPKTDPIRIQKGLFLLAMEGDIPEAERYDFVPYNFGACSFDIYGDLDLLVREGVLERIQAAWDSWPTYRPTSAGFKQAREAMQAADAKTIGRLRGTKARLSKQGFAGMLREIYQKYPDYAVNSLLKIT